MSTLSSPDERIVVILERRSVELLGEVIVSIVRPVAASAAFRYSSKPGKVVSFVMRIIFFAAWTTPGAELSDVVPGSWPFGVHADNSSREKTERSNKVRDWFFFMMFSFNLMTPIYRIGSAYDDVIN